RSSDLRENIVHSHVYHGRCTRQVDERLCLFHIQVNITRVQFANPQFKDSHYIDDGFAALPTVQPQLVSHPEPQFVGQLAAHQSVTGRNTEATVNHGVLQINNSLISLWVDSQKSDGFQSVPPARKGRTGNDG